jgi:hypothetical protein
MRLRDRINRGREPGHVSKLDALLRAAPMPEAGCAAPPPATTRTPPAHCRTYRPALPTTRIFPTRAEYNAVLIAALMALIDAGLGDLSLSGSLSQLASLQHDHSLCSSIHIPVARPRADWLALHNAPLQAATHQLRRMRPVSPHNPAWLAGRLVTHHLPYLRRQRGRPPTSHPSGPWCYRLTPREPPPLSH